MVYEWYGGMVSMVCADGRKSKEREEREEEERELKGESEAKKLTDRSHKNIK